MKKEGEVMDISYTELRKLRLKAYCYDIGLICISHHLYHVALAIDAYDESYYYLLEYSDAAEKWYILHDGINKEWLQEKYNKRSAEIDEDLAGLIDL